MTTTTVCKTARRLTTQTTAWRRRPTTTTLWSRRSLAPRRRASPDIILGLTLSRCSRLLIHVRATFDDGIGQFCQDDLHRTHGVIIRRNHDIGHIRIAVRIENADHRNVHPHRLTHAVLFTARVNHHDR